MANDDFIDSDGFLHYVKPDEPLRQKLFFNLHIYSLQDGQNLYLSFSKDGQPNFLASRVLPGETLMNAVSHELKESLNINKWEFFGDTFFADKALDKQGNMINRVDVHVAVPFFEVEGKQIIGMDAQWQVINDEPDEFQKNAGLDRFNFYSQLADAINMERSNRKIPNESLCKLAITWDDKYIDENLLDRRYDGEDRHPTSEDLMYHTRSNEMVIYYENPISKHETAAQKHKTIGTVNIAFYISPTDLKVRPDLKGIREQLVFPEA